MTSDLGVDIGGRIGGIEIENVIGNSPGPLKDEKSWKEVGQSVAGFITAGSFCVEAREGNSGDVYWTDRAPFMALNSLGLPGRAPQDYLEPLERLRQFDKPVIVSIAGFKPDDYIWLARIFGPLRYIIELNLTCPNVSGHGIFAYDLRATRKTIAAVRDLVFSHGWNNTVVVKLNAHPDQNYIEDMSRIINDEEVDAVALCNTVPNCLVLDPDTLDPVITTNDGLAGLSGEAINPIVMGQVRQYRRELDDSVSIIFEGGVSTGRSALHAVKVGASAVRSATEYSRSGANGLQRITTELIEEMDRLSLISLSDMK